MWGFEILRSRGSLADASRHFALALQSNRNREYVRRMQIAALLWARDSELENEAIRVANEMRERGETMPSGTPEGSYARRLWSVYHSRLLYGHDKPQFLAALSPPDHLATFRWLYPEDQLPKQNYDVYLYIFAELQELNGDRANALASYRQLRTRIGNSRGSLLDGSNAGIKRLSN
jgi:hypothetical protein